MRFALLLLVLLLGPAPVGAHEVRPALLRIDVRADGRYDIAWKRPVMGDYAVRLIPRIEGGLIDRPADAEDVTAAFQLKLWRRIDAGPGGLEGQRLAIEGLEHTITDVLVYITTPNGNMRQFVLTPEKPAMTLAFRQGAGVAVPAYLLLGIEHILTGYDHLAFVLGLVLLVASRSMLIKTVTAFTLAHSITLGFTALGVVTVNSALIEALVALSIMFVAIELVYVYKRRGTMMARYPWAIALAFGLLHGCAFAGALAEIGLPENAVLPSLLLFNVGVEVGQLLFVAVIIAIGWVLASLPHALPGWTRWVPPYAIGSLAAFWFIDRLHSALVI